MHTKQVMQTEIKAHYKTQIYNPKTITINKLNKTPIYQNTTQFYTAQGQHDPFCIGNKNTDNLGDSNNNNEEYTIAGLDYFATFDYTFKKADYNGPSGLVTNPNHLNYDKFVKNETFFGNPDLDNGRSGFNDYVSSFTNTRYYPYTIFNEALHNYVPVQEVMKPNTVIPTATNQKYKQIDWFSPISVIKSTWYIANINLDNVLKPNNVYSKIRVNGMDYFYTYLGLLIPVNQIAKVDNFNTIVTKDGHIWAINKLIKTNKLNKGDYYIIYHNQTYKVPVSNNGEQVQIKQLNLGPIAINSKNLDYHANKPETKTSPYYKFKGKHSYVDFYNISTINGQPIKQY